MDTDVEHQPPSTSTLDMASSLRAAALLSRKRRRVDPDASALPPRLAPEPTFQLDYGHDDPAAPNPSPVSHLTVPEPIGPAEDIEDGQIREEGEISDTEASPPPRRSPTPPPRLRQRPFTSQPKESARVEMSLPPSAIEAPIASPLMEPSDAQQWPPASLEPFMLETSTYRLDADHVRPGLSMTQDQYNTAKNIVLDLLGWGVPPEYLLECGLSRHVVFYVFSELNLRLPSNLDTSGLIPYPTPEMLALIPVSPSLSTRSLHSSYSTMPPPSIIPARVSLAERVSMERIDTRMSSPDPSPYIKAEPSSPSSIDLSSSHSLLAIEQQRRQELLARKAAIASRRARQEPLGFVTPSKDQDIDMRTVPAQSVDDFLKTIDPAPHLDAGDNDNHNRGSSVGTTSLSSSGHMDVDDLIPGLIGASRDTSTSSAEPSSAQSKSSSSTAIYADLHSPVALPTGSTDDAGTTGNGTEPSSATSVDMASSGLFTPTLQGNPSHASLDGDSGYPQRRGMKRPVAADFVDFDSGPPSRGHGNSSANGYSNGGPYPNSLSRRKAGSFAGISGIRRCVIELSDSEDDSDNQARGDRVGNSENREYSPAVSTAFTTRVPSRLTATPTMPSSLTSSGVTNGNTGQPFPTSPATHALAEKEEEIKKMRQLIAQREELRSKKLAAMSGKSAPLTPPTAEVQAPEGTMTVKQEETPAGSLGRRSSSTLFPSRERENNPSSIPELPIRHGISAAMVDGKLDVLTSDNSATIHTSGTPGSTGNRNDLSTQETSLIGRELSVQDGDGDSEDEQDLMVTGERQSEQAAPSPKEDTHQESLAAGDSGTSSSAQVFRLQLPQSRNEAAPELSRSGFPLYDSPLSRYPLLRLRFGPDAHHGNTSFVNLQSEITTASQASTRSTYSASVPFPSPISCATGAVSSHSSSPIPLPDLKQLKETVQHRSLAELTRRSTDLRVCPYEVPGGGVCRDKDCGELHLNQVTKGPSDTEVAAYVHGLLPRPWNGRCDVRAIEIALEGVRLRGGTTDVDSRVREALGGLGIPIH